ncbi:glycine/sarcosine/betaine reductase component B subunit [Clostridium swellfunianum]|uniref:glycine/sarcosine/betaine reductase component B subunit n=1 Tax=Clostridium swellfunianum TaxID=1367462 RepID=UPI00202E8CD7|nr:glycine/sarcosine/betaine reductase component B subunit [Clostridium swellfunianum]MCM0648102.1 glycine/sarcosine/betaine reductase component B subunit [Clostridium swellfunianum]
MQLIRQYFNIKDVLWGDRTFLLNGILTICKQDLKDHVRNLFKAVEDVDFEIVKPGENTRIIHLLDTLQPMYKIEGSGIQYSGFFGSPITVGEGTTNLLRGFSVMESAALPWEESSASSGLLYPRDAIMDMSGPISGFTPFSETINLVILYKLTKDKSSIEYDNDIRLIGIKISSYLASLTKDMLPDEKIYYTIDDINPELPSVVLVWQCQNQGPYANTFLYGQSIDNLVPTLLHPNELLDGCVVSGNYVWPAFKVPTYLHVNHPIVMELFKSHGKTLNFRGVIFCRSHNPSNWHKERCANFNVKLAKYLNADGLIMAWEGGGNAAVDGMLTIQCAEKKGIKASAITFEFGGVDGTEGILLVDDVPEADAIISGGSIEKHYRLPQVTRVVGGDVLRLDKESGGYFPPSDDEIEFDNTTHLYLSGNQSGYSKLFAESY